MRAWFRIWWTTFRFRHTLLEMLVALSLAFLVWLYTHSRAQDSIDRALVPVQIQLAAQQRDQFLSETTFCGTLHVETSHLVVPAGVTIDLADESGIPVIVHRVA